MTMDKPVTLAVIVGAHGVTGEVRLKLLGEGLDSLKLHKKFNGGTLTAKKMRPNKLGAVARFEELTDRNMAEAARGTELTVPRSELPDLAEDEFYHIDMIGLACVSSTGEDLGKTVAVANFGASDVLEIQMPSGKKFMVPTDAVDLKVDPAVVDADFVI